jgi:hypothetical protein
LKPKLTNCITELGRATGIHVVMSHTRDYSPGEISVPLISSYCSRWGYILEQFDDSTATDCIPAWNKIVALERLMPKIEKGQWLTWIDADLLILRPEIPLERFIIPKRELIFSRDHNGVCSGFFLIKNSPLMRRFLAKLWQEYTSEWPWEQLAIKKVLANSRRFQRTVGEIPESLVQNPSSAFNEGAFAMHFWAATFGTKATRDAMYDASHSGWSREAFLKYSRRCENTFMEEP